MFRCLKLAVFWQSMRRVGFRLSFFRPNGALSMSIFLWGCCFSSRFLVYSEGILGSILRDIFDRFSIFGPQMLIGVAAAELSPQESSGHFDWICRLFCLYGRGCGRISLGKITQDMGGMDFSGAMCLLRISIVYCFL